jgi:homocysteine S-methyltransferase
LAIHQDYVQAGADLLTTNTFRTHARNLGSAALAKDYTTLAVHLAQSAAQTGSRQVWIAGSAAPLEDCYSPHLTPDYPTCQREHLAHMENLAAAGVDFALIETMPTQHETLAAAQAAHHIGLPFMVSFVLNADFDLLSGEALAAAIQAITPLQPLSFLINCIPTRHIAAAVQKLRALTPRPIGAYGNMGTPDEVQGWAFENALSPLDYCLQARAWLELGAKIIGSCCGSTPHHTAALRRLLDQREPKTA